MYCNSLISDTDVENIYKDGKIISKNISHSFSSVDCSTKKILIIVFDKHNINMLHRPIERLYFQNKQLFSDSSKSGKVVKHEYFMLKDEFQGKNIASNVHVKELETYKINGFLEIQLDAAWDGLVVWKKLFYNFATVRDENLIKVAIQRYLREVKNMSLEEIDKAIKNNPFSINPSYLKDRTNPDNDFKHWVYKNCKGIGLAKMYKEVA
ncbi:hypothetical protein GCM10012288_22270 [Malaciobacter pacificus]|uniref:Uncharacterized protein n=1 Tax=Malaciobacter pacificus TaxID=1080223 RepID=A0A5C2HES3_9BACT|nr:hypothetical protein [Malaciobacter pacificus]QEP34892.1 hypothetical protein APAC_1811 [Malaciobacter pacificus]GGD47585.1 hypothetical protein GCM10012288_22270 [Malaciobacter pacificus]